jgi:hypothetical protein
MKEALYYGEMDGEELNEEEYLTNFKINETIGV